MTTIPAPEGEAPPRERLSIGSLPVTLLVGMVRFYQAFISPMSPPSCKYYPSCSQYTLIALRRHGVVRGLGLALWRLLRCNPWSLGGVDDVPPVRGAHTHTEG